MKDSKLEILEGRITALEKIIANAPGPKPEPEDADDRTERIFNIINEVTKIDHPLDPMIPEMKRGIRKALNEFYRGPYNGSNDMQARLTALQNENEALKKQNSKLIAEIMDVVPVADFSVGDPVKKIEGYSFPGEVRGVIKKINGDIVYAVEAIGDSAGNYAGMLHIFNGRQLADAVEPTSAEQQELGKHLHDPYEELMGA